MSRRLASIRAVVIKDLRALKGLTAMAVTLSLLTPWYDEVWRLISFQAPLLAVAVSAVLILAVVQVDAPASVRHDWLVRPIRRLDMVLAKAIFVVLTVGLPMLIGHALHRLVNMEYSIGEALLSSAGQLVLAGFILPALAVVSVTANKIEAAVAAIGLFALLVLGGFLDETISEGREILAPGARWLGSFLAVIVFAAVSVLVLWLQYGRRRTQLARACLVAGATMGVLTLFLPSIPANAESQAETYADVRIMGQTACLVDGPFKPFAIGEPNQWRTEERHAAGAGAKAVLAKGDIAGLPAGWVVAVDRLDAHYQGGGLKVTPAGGTVLTRAALSGDYAQSLGPKALASSWLLSWREAKVTAAPDARLRIDARLTLMEPVRTYRFAATGKRRFVAGLGYCGVGFDERLGRGSVNCLNVWPQPTQVTFRFSGQPHQCDVGCAARQLGGDYPQTAYAPIWARLPIERRYQADIFGGRPGDKVVATVYRPAARLHRQIVVDGPLAICTAPPR